MFIVYLKIISENMMITVLLIFSKAPLMKKYIGFIVIPLMVYIMSCTLDDLTQPEAPSWDVQVDIPVLERSITFMDFIEDSLFVTQAHESTYDSIYAFRKSLEIPSISFGQDLILGQISGKYSTSLGRIRFAETEKILLEIPFSALYPALYDSLLQLFDENTMTVTLNEISPQSFEISVPSLRFPDIKHAEIESGVISLTIRNGLFSEIEPGFEAQIQSQGQPILASFENPSVIPIESSAILSEEIQNTTLTDDIEFRMTGKLFTNEKSQTALTKADLNSSVQLEISARELQAIKSDAQTPPQVITKSDTIKLGPDSQYIKYLGFSYGYLSIQFLNNLPLDSDVYISIPALVNASGDPFRVNLSAEELSEVQKSYSLQDWKINLSNVQKYITYQYEVITENSGEEYVSLTSEDKVDLKISVSGLQPAELHGTIPRKTFTIEPVTYNLPELPEDLGKIRLSEVNISANIASNIQLPLYLNLIISAYNSEGDSASTVIKSWDVNGKSKVEVPNAEELVNILPNRIMIRGLATIEGSGSILSRQSAKGSIDITVPVDFEVRRNTLIPMDPKRVKSEFPDEIRRFTLYTEINNRFEFGTDILFLASDSLPMLPERTTKLDTLGILTWPAFSGGLDSLHIPEEKMNWFSGSFYLQPVFRFLSRVNAVGDTLPTRVFTDDSLHAVIYSSIKYKNGESKNSH